MNVLFAAVTAANCYTLPPDQRAYCQAMEHREAAYCYSIQDDGLREQCRAVLHQESSLCDGIEDITERRLCRSKVENMTR